MTDSAATFETNANTKADTEIIPIYIVLLPELLMLDVVGPAEVFAYANRYGKNHFKLYFVGPQTSLKNSLGMKLSVDSLPTTVEPNAWLLVTGMVGNEIKLDTPSLHKVCGAFFIIQQPGFRQHQRTRTNTDHFGKLMLC